MREEVGWGVDSLQLLRSSGHLTQDQSSGRGTIRQAAVPNATMP